MDLLIRPMDDDITFLADGVLLVRAQDPLVRCGRLGRDLVRDALRPVDGWRGGAGAGWRGGETDGYC